jgi:prepilin-type N-terminal cleavage/methylation domain-containing protein
VKVSGASGLTRIFHTQVESTTARRVRGGSSRAAFTLIELVISSAIMVLILTASYLCLNAALMGQRAIEPRAEVFQNARVAMAMITADLRAACPLSKDFEFLGMQRMVGDVQADNLDFATHNYTPRREREADFCEISYFADAEGDTGNVTLYRRRNPTVAPDPLVGGRTDFVARGLRGVAFEYYDGWDWYDSWGEADAKKKDRKESLLAPNLTGMPEAVRVTLWFDPNPKQANKSATKGAASSEPAMMFETTVRLNLTAASQTGFAGRGQKGDDSTTDNTTGDRQ